MRKIPINLEKALLNLDTYGIRPNNADLEELVRLEYLDSDENDGWNTSLKGRAYLQQYKLKDMGN